MSKLLVILVRERAVCVNGVGVVVDGVGFDANSV